MKFQCEKIVLIEIGWPFGIVCVRFRFLGFHIFVFIFLGSIRVLYMFRSGLFNNTSDSCIFYNFV